MRLLPREEKFFELFDQIAECLTVGAEMLESVLRDFRDREAVSERFRQLEHNADQLVHEVMDRLNKTFVTPLDREDIHSLVHVMDDVLDYAESSLDRMILYGINEPIPHALEMSELLVQACRQIRDGVTGLRNFGEIRGILDPCVRINELENRGDAINRSALRALFCDGMDPVTILKWREVYEHLETALDRCEDVADVLETIAVKNS